MVLGPTPAHNSRRAGISAVTCLVVGLAGGIFTACGHAGNEPLSTGVDAPAESSGHGAGYRPATASGPDYMAYVASTATNQIIPVDLADGRVGKPIRVGPAPMDLAITPNGHMAYVADSGWSSPPVYSYDVTPVELPGGHTLSPVRTGLGPFAVAITPDGKTAYVANMGSISGTGLLDMHDATTVTPIDIATGKALRPIEVGRGPGAIAVTPNGREAVVVLAGTIQHPAHDLVPIDLGTQKAGKPIPVGLAPQGVAVSPNGRWALAAITGWPYYPGYPRYRIQDTVVPVNLKDGKAGRPITVGAVPLPIVVAPDGDWAYAGFAAGVVGRGQSGITPVDMVTGRPSKPILLPGAPLGLAVTPGGHWLCAAIQGPVNGIVLVNLRTDTVGKLIPAGREVDGVAIDPVPIARLDP